MSKIEQYYYLYTPSSEISVKEKNEFGKYASKLNLEYETIESFVPTSSIEETYDIVKEKLPFLLPLEKHTWSNLLGSGTGACGCSNYYMWQKVVETNKTTVIFEHDARPLIHFDHIEIPDNCIVVLGPRVTDINSYFPPRKADTYYRVERHGGSAAYAITPKTAKLLIDHLSEYGIYDDVDQTFFLRSNSKSVSNYIEVPILAVEPPPCVVVVGENGKLKKSTLGRVSDNGIASDVNLYITPGFKEGLKND